MLDHLKKSFARQSLYAIFPKIIYVRHLPKLVLIMALVWNGMLIAKIERTYEYTVVGGGGRRG